MNSLTKYAAPELGTVDPRMIDKRTGKPKIVSEKIRKAIKLLLDGNCRTATAAAERAGVTNARFSRACREPHVAAYIREQTRASLAAGTLRASAKIQELIDARSEHVALEASSRVLAIDGVLPPAPGTNINIQNNVGVSVGYVVKLKHVEEEIGESAA